MNRWSMLRGFLPGAVAAVLASSQPVKAMEFQREDGTDHNGTVAVAMQGEIKAGEAAKFAGFLQQLPYNERVGAFHLDSPGGDVSEMLKMAAIISLSGAVTIVPDGSICASACFWLFAAGQTRVTVGTAKVGVHCASTAEGAEENVGTVGLARLSRMMNIPNQVIGKMVSTRPDQIAWLDAKDLKAMHVLTISSDGIKAMDEAMNRRSARSTGRSHHG